MLTMEAAILAACSEADPVLTVQEAEVEPSQSEVKSITGMTVLGERIPNAYTPEVMGEALTMLKAESATNKSADIELGDTEIAATHLYLRFAPRDSVDVALLDNDTTIMYTVLPMDYEVAAIGDYYHDPSLPDSVPTYQYCVARVGQPLPDVPHETLSELFLMEEANVFDDTEGGEEGAETGNKSARASVWEALEDRALEIAGLGEASTNKSSWRPQGEVYYYDNSLNKSLPMEGVPVRITRGFVTHQCCTGKDGRFRFSRRRHHVRCYVKWRRDDFHLREIGHPIQQAESTLASHTKSGVSHTFIPGYDSWLYASVFRAAHQYYYNYAAYGLSRPGDKNLIIRLSNMRKSSTLGRCYSFTPFGLSDIKIFYKAAGNKMSRDLFQTTAHEIAHSAHRLWSRKKYRDASDKMKDSWARGVEWWMVKKFYATDWLDPYHNSQYTLVVRDLIDNDKRTKTGPTHKTYTEDVSGVSMSDIEQSLRKASSWNSWRDNLVKLYPNKKEGINYVFSVWSE